MAEPDHTYTSGDEFGGSWRVASQIIGHVNSFLFQWLRLPATLAIGSTDSKRKPQPRG
jgi:hypothetical protein